MMVPGVAQRRRIDQVDMPPDQRGKRVFGMARRVFRSNSMSSIGGIYL